MLHISDKRGTDGFKIYHRNCLSVFPYSSSLFPVLLLLLCKPLTRPSVSLFSLPLSSCFPQLLLCYFIFHSFLKLFFYSLSSLYCLLLLLSAFSCFLILFLSFPLFPPSSLLFNPLLLKTKRRTYLPLMVLRAHFQLSKDSSERFSSKLNSTAGC